jgi:hypothetical protein
MLLSSLISQFSFLYSENDFICALLHRHVIKYILMGVRIHKGVIINNEFNNSHTTTCLKNLHFYASVLELDQTNWLSIDWILHSNIHSDSRLYYQTSNYLSKRINLEMPGLISGLIIDCPDSDILWLSSEYTNECHQSILK